MSFENNFCPSPWFHMKIDPQGHFRPCRWMASTHNAYEGNIRTDSLEEYFQEKMAPLREQLLDGHRPGMCDDCFHMEEHGKISGRQKQLLKIGVNQQIFEKTFLSSPMIESFHHSKKSQGRTDLIPQDWQVDLGNYCNSACLFCKPEYSSRLATEYKNLKIINQLPIPAWSDDPKLVKKFCDFLSSTSNLAYLHLLGGETLIMPSFKIILQNLIDNGLVDTHIGFTTNLTVWPEDVIELLCKFKNVHVGLSIECLHPLNDYVRWPSKLDQVKSILDRWVELSKMQGWFVQIRATPNCFTLLHVDTIYKYAYDNNIGFETCNFIERPVEMRINALPTDLMEKAKEKIKNFLDSHPGHDFKNSIINTRNSSTTKQQVWEDARSYFNYLENETHSPEILLKLVAFLKLFESNRKNSVIDYAPEYEKFLRSAGY